MKPEQQKWLLLLMLTLIWGSSFILIKKSLISFNPYQVGALRVLISGLMLLPLALVHLKKFPKKQFKWLVLAAFTGNFIPMFLFPIAETKVSSSIAGIINSMMPIFVIIVGAIAWKVKTQKKQIIGVLISFAGAILLTYSSAAQEIPVLHISLLILATIMYAVSTTTVGAKLANIPGIMLSSFVFGFVLLLPSALALVLSNFFSEFGYTHTEFVSLGYVAMLSVFGTGLAMMLQYKLLNISSPLFASTVTLLMPIVAVIWGVLDGETLSAVQIAGTIIIIAGLLFLRSKNKSRSA